MSGSKPASSGPIVTHKAIRFVERWHLGLSSPSLPSNTQGDFSATAEKGNRARSRWGFGVNADLIYEPWAGTHLDLSYTSEIDVTFEDRMNLLGPTAQKVLDNRGVLDATTEIVMHAPQTLTLSLQ